MSSGLAFEHPPLDRGGLFCTAAARRACREGDTAIEDLIVDHCMGGDPFTTPEVFRALNREAIQQRLGQWVSTDHSVGGILIQVITNVEMPYTVIMGKGEENVSVLVEGGV